MGEQGERHKETQECVCTFIQVCNQAKKIRAITSTDIRAKGL